MTCLRVTSAACVRSQIEHLSAVLGQFVLRGLRAPALGAVLDLDSTVFERYEDDKGDLFKGYNPRKHGQPSRPGESTPGAIPDGPYYPARATAGAAFVPSPVPPVSG